MDQLLAQMQRDGQLAKSLAKRIQEYKKLATEELSNTYRLEKTLQLVQKLLRSLSDGDNKLKLTEWYAAEQERIRSLKDEFRFQFGRELKTALDRDGFILTGQLPTLRTGFYTIKLDFGIGFAALFWGPEVEKIRARIALNAEEISKAIVAFDRRLKGRESKSESFLKMLAEAYERHLGSHGLVPGSRVFLMDLLRELAFMSQPKKFAVNPTKENFQDYSRIHFSYDLYRLKQGEHSNVRGRQLHLSVATFDSTTEKSRSLWVPVNEQGEGTYYSYIAFVEEAPGVTPKIESEESKIQNPKSKMESSEQLPFPSEEREQGKE